ncbi:StAR-related lipid transfer protein 8 [Bienertia sinuspersici]
MAKGRRKGATSGKRKRYPDYVIRHKQRFNGRVTLYEPWYTFMEPINIRLYFGGHFVTKKNKTVYEKKPNVEPTKYGMTLRMNVEEICYFEFAYWIKSDLGFDEVGEIWFRKKGCSLHNGRARIDSDKDIPEFLAAPESDGFYHLYVVHKEEEVEDSNKLAYGPGVTFYTDTENTTGEGSEMESNEVGGSINNSKGGPQTHMVHENQTQYPRSDSTSQSALHKTASKTVFPSQTAATARRPKLPIISSQKKQPTQLSDLTNPPITTIQTPEPANVPVLAQIPETTEGREIVPQHTLESEQEDNEGSEGSEGSDVCLSDNDFEDKDDDDLFNDFVDHDIGERVTRSLGGLSKAVALYESDEGDDQGELICNDEDIVDSDDEAVSAVGSDDEGPAYPEFNPDVDFKGKIVLSKGLKFPSNKVFRRALQYDAIEQGYDYYFLHNNNSRVSAYCAHRCGCPWKRARIIQCICKSRRKCRWRIHCRKLKGEASWQIKSARLQHICGHQHKNSKITSQYLAERYLEDWRDDPNWKLSSFIKRARRECKVEIGYYLAYYARQRAFKMIFGDATREYERVWDYAAAILKFNPGSTAVVKVDGVQNPQPVFQRLYVCLQACKEGFMAGCRPTLGVDGAHLRGAYPGILLTDVGKDGNNNIFPVAWAVVEVENAETWAWFLELLRNDIASVADSITWVHEADELTYMSDRQKGLLDAFNTVMPAAETRYCCRHIWSNFKQKFPGTVYKEHFWKATRSTTEHHFKQHMQHIKDLNADAYNYLQAIPAAHWSRHKFSSSSKSGCSSTIVVRASTMY